MPDRAPAPLAIHLFGPFEVHLDGVPLPRLRSRKGQWLLALLTLRAGRELERVWLAGTLWPNSPEPQALASLRISLNDLRRALGAAAERLGAPTTQTLCLDLSGAEVDVLAFDQAVTGADRDPLRGDVALEAAVALYRGPLLEGWTEEWVFQERQAREQAYLGALETLAGRALAGGEPAAAVRHLRRALAVDPLADTAQRALMQALAASGDYAAASQVYRDFRLLLHHELNAQPAPDTEALYQQLRAEARRLAATGGGRRQTADEQDQGRSQPLAGRPSPAGRLPSLIPQDTVTFLFTDIEGSTRLWEGHPEAMRAALARHDDLLHDVIAAHGGVVFKSMGDQICAAFPTASEALGSALVAQHALQAEPWEEFGRLRVRMALHTGAAEERQGDFFGPTLSRVARLLEAGHGGQVLLSLATQELARDHLPEGACLRDLGEHRLKDLVRSERIFQLAAPDLPTEFPPLHTLDLRPNNLPAQPTPLLGREQEVAAAGERLRSEAVRLLTLTGPGGTGKTRLGLQVAAGLLDAFESGVYFVELAPISDPHLVASRIAQSLGVRESPGQPLLESVRHALRERQMLLLLDNFEHVLAAAPLVTELLVGCPRLKVLVTSRAPLHLQGEQEFPVPPLSLPDPKRLPPLDGLCQYAAVALFIQRAQAVKPEFVVTNENAPAVAAICHRLDGLPLAIILAAARIKLFPPQAMLTRMVGTPLAGARGRPSTLPSGGTRSPLQLLTGGARDLPARHQTLRGAIAWSYDLLEESEQRLFRRLSIFAGGFTLDAAEAVCTSAVVGCRFSVVSEDGTSYAPATDELLDGITSLLDKSLLRQEPGTGDEPRIGMLETIREYGRECLAASGEAELLQQRHAEFFTAFAEETAPRLLGGQRSLWLARLQAEHDNLRAAFDWCQSTRSPLALRLAGSLFWFWHFGGHIKEGWRRAQDALNVGEERTAVRARALWSAGTLAWIQRDFPAARSQLEESVTIGREVGDRRGLACSLRQLGAVLWYAGDLRAARRLLEESVRLCREAESEWDLAFNLYHLACVHNAQGDEAGARAVWEESEALYRQLGDDWGRANALIGLAVLLGRQSEYAPARAHLEEALAILRSEQEVWDTADVLTLLGEIVQRHAQIERATELYAEGLALYREVGDRVGAAIVLHDLGTVAQHQARNERAARLFAAAAALGGPALGTKLSSLASPAAREQDIAAVRAALGEDAFTAAWAVGQALTLEQTAVYALQTGEDVVAHADE